MNNQYYTSALLNMEKSLKHWKVITALLALSNVVLSFVAFSTAGKVKTILVPSHFNEQVAVDGNIFSSGYVEQVSKEVFMGLLNYNPKNIRYQYDSVLKYADGSAYQALSSMLAMDVERVQRDGISSVLYPIEFKVKDQKVTLMAEQITLVGSKVISRENKSFYLSYRSDNGLFKILSYGVSDEK